MHIGSVLLVVWLVIGAVAAGQRGYYEGTVGSCTKAGTIAATIAAGPLNYVGVIRELTAPYRRPAINRRK